MMRLGTRDGHRLLVRAVCEMLRMPVLAGVVWLIEFVGLPVAAIHLYRQGEPPSRCSMDRAVASVLLDLVAPSLMLLPLMLLGPASS